MKQIFYRKILRNFTITVIILAVILLIIELFYALKTERYTPQEFEKFKIEKILEKDTLSSSDYDFLLQQTGLGRAAIDNISDGDIITYQSHFFEQYDTELLSLLTFFTREYRLLDIDGNRAYAPPLVGVQAGDILLSFSTYTLGWNHGHAALVLDENTILESMSIGTNSKISDINTWRRYSDYVVLRPKTDDIDTGTDVAKYAKDELIDLPYNLFSGIFTGNSDGKNNAQCAYIVWYAWEEFGVNLDGDGGIIVTPHDILMSENVELVQVFGINPEIFNDKY